MGILRRAAPWGSDNVMTGSPVLLGVAQGTGPFDDYLRGGWSSSRMSGGLGWQNSPMMRIPNWTGGSGHFRIEGVTKDATGTTLAGVTVMAIRSTEDVANSRSANVQEGTIGVSDSAGNYQVMVPTLNTYRVDAYKTGSPDVAGSTVNTLVGV